MRHPKHASLVYWSVSLLSIHKEETMTPKHRDCVPNTNPTVVLRAFPSPPRTYYLGTGALKWSLLGPTIWVLGGLGFIIPLYLSTWTLRDRCSTQYPQVTVGLGARVALAARRRKSPPGGRGLWSELRGQPLALQGPSRLHKHEDPTVVSSRWYIEYGIV